MEDYDCFCNYEYTVLKKDKAVRHGEYKSTWVTGNPREEGYYSFGLKDSLWIYYNRFKPIVGSRGRYHKGKKVETWEYFDDRGDIMNRYNHSTGYLSYTTFVDTVKSYQIRLEDTIVSAKPERSPIYLAGEKNKFRTIQENIVYPQDAIDANIFGTVMIAFYVNKNGVAIEHEIMKSIGGGCDEEALRVVQLIPDEWAPAIHEGKLAEARVIIPITFQLN